MTIILCKLDESHYQKFKDLRTKHLELEPQSVGTVLKDHLNASKEQFIALLKCTNQPPSDFTFGAFDGDNLVGMLGFKREVRKSSLNHKAGLWGFFVLPHYRNKGIGSDLIQFVLQETQANNWCEMIRIMLSSEDLAVRHLAEKYGFESYGFEKNSRKINGVYYHDYYYNKYFTTLSKD